MIVSKFMHKGGVGKSTLSCTLAAGCARAGLSTLLVEADGQGTASHYMGVEPLDQFRAWMKGGLSAVDVRAVPMSFHGKGELHILSAARQQREIEADPNTPRLLYERLRELNAYADVVIIDTSPGRTHIHTGVLYGADYVLIPTTCDKFSRDGLEDVMQDYDNAAAAGQRSGFPIASLLGIVPNRFIAREDNQQANYTYLHEVYDSRCTVFPFIRDLAVWRQATEWNQSIYEWRTQTEASDYSRRQARSAVHEFQPVLDATLAAFGSEAAV